MVNEIAKYEFTETSGTTLDDSSGNNYDATLNELVFADGFWQPSGSSPSPDWGTPGGNGGPYGSSNSIKSYQFISFEKNIFYIILVLYPIVVLTLKILV